MRYSERLSSLKLRISCFGLRKMQLLTLSPDYSNMSFLFACSCLFEDETSATDNLSIRKCVFGLMLRIILNLTQSPCLPQYINRCCRETLLSPRCPFDQSEFGSA